MSGPAWQQFLAMMDCRDCKPSKGRAWVKEDSDGKPVVVTVDPCEKHQRMLDTQRWRLE